MAKRSGSQKPDRCNLGSMTLNAGFNLGVALEEQGKLREAIGALETTVAVQPGMADAHYNLGRLYELVGDPKAAVRHWSAYRRLMGS